MLYFGVELQPAGMARFQNTTTKRSTVFWLGIWVTYYMHWNLTNTVLCSGVVFWAKKRSYCVLAYRVWRCYLWSDWRQTWRTDARPTTDTRIIKTHFFAKKIELLRFGIVRQRCRAEVAPGIYWISLHIRGDNGCRIVPSNGSLDPFTRCC